MAPPQSALPCPWLAYGDTPRRLPATRTNGPNVAPWPARVSPPEVKRGERSSPCDRLARPAVVPTLAMSPSRGVRSEQHQAEISVEQCAGGCVAGAVGPTPDSGSGDPAAEAKGKRGPRRCRRSRRPIRRSGREARSSSGVPAVPATRPQKRSRRKVLERAFGPATHPPKRSGREVLGRATGSDDPSAEAVGSAESWGNRSTRILAAASGRRAARGLARGRRSSPRAATSRSQQRCPASPSDAPAGTPKRSRRLPVDALHHPPERRQRPRGPLSSVDPTSVQSHPRDTDAASHSGASSQLSAERPKSLRVITDLPRSLASAARAPEHMELVTESPSRCVRRPEPLRTSTRGSEVSPPPCPATLSRREDRNLVSSARASPGPYRVRFAGGPPMGFRTLRRLQKQAATCAGPTTPGYVAPSGFLSLLTPCSACNLSGLVSCR
jgi:hypothetical protein